MTSTIPFWLNDPSLEKLDSDRTVLPNEADVVVIGGGIAGFSTAFHLSQLSGLRVVVLERRQHVCDGATGRNGGHLAPSWHGDKDVVEYEAECVRQIERFVHEYRVDCALRFG